MRLTKALKSEVVLTAVFCFLVGITVMVSPVLGQERFGGLNGVAMDETGAVLPSVTVTATNQTTNRAVTTVSGSDGTYIIRNIEPGPYAIKFELPGFSALEFPHITVLVGQTLKLDATMRVGGVETTVEVTDVVPLIDLQSTLVAHNVSQEEFDRLPKSRTFQSVAITAPSVNAGEIEGGIQVNGSSGAENVFNIDGITTNSGINGASRQNAPFEYLSEVQVKTAGIEAEYGGALGGVITAVTKSGGNEFHGEGHYYYSGDRISASPVKRLVLDPRDPLLNTVVYIQDEKTPTSQHEPGFSLGGPIVRDKLFFLTSMSPRWAREDRLYRYGNNTDSGDIERKQTFMSAFNKISFDPTSRIRSNFTMLWSPTKSHGTLVAYNGSGPNWDSRTRAGLATNVNRGFFAPQVSYTGNVDFIFSSNVLLSTRGGYFWDNYKDSGIPSTVSYTYQTVATAGLVGSALAGPFSTTNTPRARQNLHDLVTRAYGQADISVSGAFGGFHNFKAGYGLQKTVNNVDQSYAGGYVFLWWDDSFDSPATPASDPQRGTYGYYEVNDVGTKGSTGAGIKSFYVQDQWNIHPQITLNIGLRAERERIPSFRRDIKDYAFDFSWSDKIAPRLGGSVDLFGDGRVKLFGSWGRYFDWTKYELVRGTFGGDTWRIFYRSLDSLAIDTFSLSNLPGRDLWNPGVTAFRDQRVPAFGSTSVDPDIKPMSQDQWSFGADYQWNNQMVFGVRYIHQNLRRTIEDLGVIVAGDEHYIYANPGEGIAQFVSRASGATPLPIPYPKPARDYDAFELVFNRRLSGGWFGNASYTWSRLYGNYAGLASSDQIFTPTTGVGNAIAQQQGAVIASPGNNANRAWDLDELLFDSRGNFNVKGPLATDRPHVFKFNGGYGRTWAYGGTTDIGGFFYLGSGTPLSTQVLTTHNIPVYVNGRGDLGRTAVLNYTDLQVGHTIQLTENQRLRFEFNMLNLFNQKTARHRFESLNRGSGVRDAAAAINLGPINLRNGYNYDALIRASSKGANAFDPRFEMDDLFDTGFAGRFGVKWTF